MHIRYKKTAARNIKPGAFIYLQNLHNFNVDRAGGNQGFFEHKHTTINELQRFFFSLHFNPQQT